MTSEPASDEQLIVRARAGHVAATRQLIERYRPLATRAAFAALRNGDDAQDVAQESLIYASLHLSDLHNLARFGPWLRAVTLSRAADYRRRRGTRQLGEPITVLNEAREEERYAEQIAVRDAVAHLPPHHRLPLVLHYVGGWSVEEVGRLLSLPANTVRSRLMAAKRLLRADLHPIFGMRTERPTMTVTKSEFDLTQDHHALLSAAFPDARVVSVDVNPEPWMPFERQVRLALEEEETTFDIRGDIDPARAQLLPVLERLGIDGPRLVHGPVARTDGDGYLSLCHKARGENLLLWTLGGTPHRIRLATERAFESIDRLQFITDGLMAGPVGATVERRTLADEVAAIYAVGGPHLDDPWFRDALAQVEPVAAQITTPLVYTHYLHFFPNFVRVDAGRDPFNEPFGWPGDPRNESNPLSEYVSPWGHFGDLLLGLAMVWIYDCYPFVHTGFVEQFLWRRGVTKREFAPRLMIKGLQTIQRELPPTAPPKKPPFEWEPEHLEQLERYGITLTPEGGFPWEYWDGLHGWVDQARTWL